MLVRHQLVLLSKDIAEPVELAFAGLAAREKPNWLLPRLLVRFACTIGCVSVECLRVAGWDCMNRWNRHTALAKHIVTVIDGHRRGLLRIQPNRFWLLCLLEGEFTLLRWWYLLLVLLLKVLRSLFD